MSGWLTPAVAYYEVVELLGEEYFTAGEPPAHGTRLTVTGTDGVPTVWDMDAATAHKILAALRDRRDLAVKACTYTYPRRPEVP